MNQAGFLSLQNRVQAKAARDCQNQDVLLDLGIAIDSVLKSAVPISGAVSAGSIGASGDFVSGSFELVPPAKMLFAVKAVFKGVDGKEAFSPVVNFEVTMNGQDFDVKSLSSGRKEFVARDDRKAPIMLRPVVEMVAADLEKTVADFEKQ